MSAIHKRLHYAQKKEFKILARIIADYLPPEYPYAVGGQQKMILKQDFGDDVDVIPVSDPNIFSMAQRAMLAQNQLQMAQAAPEIHDLRESYRRMYDALEIKDPDSLLKPEQKPQRLSPASENSAVIENIKLQAYPDQDHMSHIQAHISFAKLPIVQQNPDYYTNLVQNIMQHIKFIAEQTAQQQLMQQTKGNQMLMQQMQGQVQGLLAKLESEMINKIIEQLAPNQPDPMVQMHDKEMQIKHKDIAMKYEQANAKLQSDMQAAIESEVTKRMKIIADEQKANQDIAQKRETAYLNANQKAQEVYQKSIVEAAKNDTATIGGING